jgi:hypothetical protein
MPGKIPRGLGPRLAQFMLPRYFRLVDGPAANANGEGAETPPARGRRDAGRLGQGEGGDRDEVGAAGVGARAAERDRITPSRLRGSACFARLWEGVRVPNSNDGVKTRLTRATAPVQRLTRRRSPCHT